MMKGRASTNGKASSIKERIGLSIKFSMIVLAIFLITNLIIGHIAILFITSSGGQRTDPVSFILAVLASVILLGTIVSFILSSFPLNPMNKLIRVIDSVSQGDFSVRLDVTRPKEFKNLADSVNRMAEELGSTELLRSDFVSNFSHEFKTPIASINGFAEQLLYDDLTEEERSEYLAIIIKESRRLSDLSTSVLELSKVETQVALHELASFNLAEQIRCCVVVLEPQWREKAIDIVLDLEELSYRGNEDMLDQVWINLLDNAIKFTPGNGRVCVSLLRKDDAVVVSVSDSGVGMGESTIKYAFNKFYQGDPSRSTRGNGIGLTLAKRIIELHQGSIVLASEEGVGTTVRVELPSH